MISRIHSILAALVLVIATGCATGMPGPHRHDTDKTDRTSGGSGKIFTADELRQESGTVLEVLSRRMHNLRVDRRFSCPAISLRNLNLAPGLTEPSIYVDGVNSIDTCILDLLSIHSVERVEVYPSGLTPYPQFPANSYGMILITTRK